MDKAKSQKRIKDARDRIGQISGDRQRRRAQLQALVDNENRVTQLEDEVTRLSAEVVRLEEQNLSQADELARLSRPAESQAVSTPVPTVPGGPEALAAESQGKGSGQGQGNGNGQGQGNGQGAGA